MVKGGDGDLILLSRGEGESYITKLEDRYKIDYLTAGVEVGDVREMYQLSKDEKDLVLVSDNESTIVLEIVKTDKKVEVKQVEESSFSS